MNVSAKIASAIISTVLAISSGVTCGSTCLNIEPAVAGTERAGALHVDALADALHLRADQPGGARPVDDPDDDDDVRSGCRPKSAATMIISGMSGITRM